jgi:hypothetical protein
MADATIPSAGGGAPDIAAIMQSVLGSNQAQLGELAKKAATPIPGGHVTQMPLTMQQGPKTLAPMQMDNRDVVGRGNARAQGIGNAVRGVVHALASTETALDNKKKLEVASATQQLLTAQQAYDQAAQLVKQDPSNADAKAAMERNKSVMNGILSNDKIRKAIAKGMNIDFTDPKANDTLEHQGVAQGKKMATEHADWAEQFNQKTPTQMQPNQQAIAQYQAAQEAQKAKIETFKAIIPYISTYTRAQGEITKADIDAISRLYTEREAANKALELEHQRFNDEYKLAGYKSSLERANQAAKDSNPAELMKAYETASKDYADAMDKASKDSIDIAAQIAKLGTGSANQNLITSLRGQQSRIDAGAAAAERAFTAERNFLAKTAGVDIQQLTVPQISVTPQAGGSSNGSSNTGTSKAGPDINPFKNRAFDSNTPTIDRLLVKSIFGLGEFGQTLKTLDRKGAEAFRDTLHPAAKQPSD